MDCPVCKNVMITLELDDVEVDHCLECHGIWLDVGELEMLLDDSAQAGDLLASFTPAKNCAEKLRKCPICLKKMRKILVNPGQSDLLIDSCRKNHGLWFDEGELLDILSQASLDEHNKIKKLLTDIFAKPDTTETSGKTPD